MVLIGIELQREVIFHIGDIKRVERMMTKRYLEELLSRANKKFGTNFVLGGGWRDNGFSDHDVDVEVSVWDDNTHKAAKWIFDRINQHLDVHYVGCIEGETNYFFCRDGREGFVKDVPKVEE